MFVLHRLILGDGEVTATKGEYLQPEVWPDSCLIVPESLAKLYMPGLYGKERKLPLRGQQDILRLLLRGQATICSYKYQYFVARSS